MMSRTSPFIICMFVAFVGCSSGGGGITPSEFLSSRDVASGAAQVAFPSRESAENAFIYVVNGTSSTGSVTVYAKHAHGNVAPIETISGPNTGLSRPMGIAVDGAGNIYVSDWFGTAASKRGRSSQQGVVFVYAAGANGDVKPIATISDGLNYPYGIALDSDGNVYVGNYEGGNVTVYATRTYKPIRTIQGKPSLGYVCGVAVDGAGRLYVVTAACEGSGADSGSGGGLVYVYAAGAQGNAVPIQTIGGSKTGLTSPIGIAVNGRRQIYVTNWAFPGNPAVLVYATGANGDVKPIRNLGGPNTQLAGTGIALDSPGDIFIANQPPSENASIAVYRGRANGDAAPIGEITGDATGLEEPSAIAVR
jgi:hypothetical protein